MCWHSALIVGWLFGFAGLLLSHAAEPTSTPVTLTVVWHAGNLADLLMDISKEYTKQTGVELRGVFPAMGSPWTEAIATEFARHGSDFDLVVFDSQEMSGFASQRHVERLNHYLDASRTLQASDFDAFSLRQYAEYPEGSGDLYALPINQDCMGLIYRKDLFDDPAERGAFQAQHHRPLKVPETYAEMLDIAAFFTRPTLNLYGIGLYGSQDYDACTTPFNCLLWSYGGELWNPQTRRVAGVLNSPAAVRALDDPRFRTATPYNDAFVTSMRMTKDYWHVAQYPQLLAVYQRDVHAALTGDVAPKEALDRCAREQDAILRQGAAVE